MCKGSDLHTMGDERTVFADKMPAIFPGPIDSMLCSIYRWRALRWSAPTGQLHPESIISDGVSRQAPFASRNERNKRTTRTIRNEISYSGRYMHRPLDQTEFAAKAIKKDQWSTAGCQGKLSCADCDSGLWPAVAEMPTIYKKNIRP